MHILKMIILIKDKGLIKMKAKWKISFLSALLSVSFLTACNMGNNEFNEQDEVDYSPVRYDQNTNLNDNDNKRTNRPFNHDENPNQTDQELEKGNDLEFNKNRGDQ